MERRLKELNDNANSQIKLRPKPEYSIILQSLQIILKIKLKQVDLEIIKEEDNF